MRTLVIGDVHGCSRELDLLLQRVGPDRVVYVGDLYTKGPDPAGVWKLVAASGGVVVRGNHDQRLADVVNGRRPHDKHGAACAAALDAADPDWRAHLAAMPTWIEDVAGFTVVHAGVHPSGDLAATTFRMAITMRRFPDEDVSPHWADQYVGERRVIFGHDAVRGLVRRERDGRPWVIGLDSGCVYGGALTGYIPEEDGLVSVAAERVYKSIG